MEYNRPLGILERAIVRSHRAGGAFNIVVILHLDNAPKADALRKSIKRLQNRHPILRMSTSGFNFTEIDELIPVDETDRDDWMKLAEEILNIPFEDNAPLMHMTLVSGETPGAAVLLIRYHHLLMDGSSTVWFLNELLKGCKQDYSYEQAYLYPMTDPLESRFPVMFQGIRKFSGIARFMLNQVMDELGYALRMRGKYRPEIKAAWTNKIISRTLSRSDSENIIRAARERRLSLNAVLNAAMVLAVWKHYYQSQPRLFRTMTFADLRPYLSPPAGPETLGGYLSFLRYTLPLRGDASLWDTAKCFQETTEQSFKRAEKYAAVVLSDSLINMVTSLKIFRMADTALSFTGTTRFSPDIAPIAITRVSGFVANYEYGPIYTGQSRLFNGQICWDIGYGEQDINAEMAQRITDEMVGMLAGSGK